MSTQLNKDIQKAIVENLPQATAGELKKYLTEAEEAIEKLANLELDLEFSERKIKELTTAAEQHADLLNRESEVSTRERKVEDRERKLKLDLMEQKVEMMEKHETRMVDLITKVAGHPSVTVSGYKSFPMLDNGYVSQQNETDSKTTTEGKS